MAFLAVKMLVLSPFKHLEEDADADAVGRRAGGAAAGGLPAHARGGRRPGGVRAPLLGTPAVEGAAAALPGGDDWLQVHRDHAGIPLPLPLRREQNIVIPDEAAFERFGAHPVR